MVLWPIRARVLLAKKYDVSVECERNHFSLDRIPRSFRAWSSRSIASLGTVGIFVVKGEWEIHT